MVLFGIGGGVVVKYIYRPLDYLGDFPLVLSPPLFQIIPSAQAERGKLTGARQLISQGGAVIKLISQSDRNLVERDSQSGGRPVKFQCC